MKKNVNFIAVLLTICMTLSVFAGFAPASAAEQPEQTDDEVQESFALPDIVSMEEAQEHGYVGRVEEEESDLYTMVFRSEDGTNTMRVYSHPVKYMDVNGEVKDISLNVAAKADGSFVSESHDIQTTFRRKLTDGITLAYDDIEVTMLPKAVTGIGNPTASVSSDRKTVTYTLDERTSYEYTLTYTGFKEDIVVTEYTGQTDYEFRLYTGGLAVSEQCDSYFLVDEDGNIKAAIGDIIVFTADERNNTMGSLFCETVVENEEYLLTIHLDREYLADERTAYPIRIDPTIEINYEKDGDGAIEDVTINSLRGSAGSSSSMYVGLRDTYGISRTLMKFPGLDLSGVASASSITSARVEIRDILCEKDELTVYCHVFNGDWEEDTASWDTVSHDNYNSTALDEQTISYALGVKLDPRHRYSFDITSVVKTWKTNATAKNRGIIFKVSSDIEYGSTTIRKTFASYNRSSNQPSLTVEYEDAPVSISLNKDKYSINEGSTTRLTATTSPSGQTVTWLSSNTAVATVSSTGLVTGKKAGNTIISASITSSGTTYTATCTIYVTISNGLYLIYSDYFGSNDLRIVDTEGGDVGYTRNNTPVQSWSISNVSSELNERQQLYKITYLENGCYSIRPMTNNRLGLTENNKEVSVQDGIGSVDDFASVPNAYKWLIQWTTDGKYSFRNIATRRHLSLPTNSVDGTNLTGNVSSTNSNNHWGILKYTGSLSEMRGIKLHTNGTHIVPMGSSIDISDIGTKSMFYSYISGENALTCTYTVENLEGGASPLAYISGTNLISYANKAGMVTVKAQFGSGTNAIIESLGFYIKPPEGQFFYLQNTQVINGFIQSNVLHTTPTKVEANFDPEQIWQIEYDTENTSYFLIKNVKTGQYLTSPQSTAVNAQITLENKLPYQSMLGSGNLPVPNFRQLWKITPAASGSGASALRSLYMEMNSDNLWLNVRSSDNALIQHTYVNNSSYYDEFDVLYMGNEVFVQRSHPYDETDFRLVPYLGMLHHLSNHYDLFELMHRTVQLTYDEAIDFAENSKVAIFCGHAEPDEFLISYTFLTDLREGNTSKEVGKLYNTDMYANGTAKVDFSGVDIVIFAGCRTAGTVSSNYNLAESAQKAGAKVAIGWTAKTGSELFDWMKYFFEALNSGKPAQKAKEDADKAVPTNGSNTSVLYGNKSFTLGS